MLQMICLLPLVRLSMFSFGSYLVTCAKSGSKYCSESKIHKLEEWLPLANDYVPSAKKKFSSSFDSLDIG